MIVTHWDDFHNKAVRLRLAPEDIEEIILRCGWTILNDARDISPADRAEMDRLLEKECVEELEQTTEDASAWWRARMIPDEMKPDADECGGGVGR